MPYVKVVGYIEVPDEDYAPTGHDPLRANGHDEIQHVPVGDLDDLRIERDDRPTR